MAENDDLKTAQEDPKVDVVQKDLAKVGDNNLTFETIDGRQGKVQFDPDRERGRDRVMVETPQTQMHRQDAMIMHAAFHAGRQDVQLDDVAKLEGPFRRGLGNQTIAIGRDAEGNPRIFDITPGVGRHTQEYEEVNKRLTEENKSEQSSGYDEEQASKYYRAAQDPSIEPVKGSLSSEANKSFEVAKPSSVDNDATLKTDADLSNTGVNAPKTETLGMG